MADATEGEIPTCPLCSSAEFHSAHEHRPLRWATQTVPRTVWLTPFESFPKPNKNTTLLGGI
ncbi:MAG: hypothetical protein IKZ23_03315, partial [Clostridia bacterium]|nr:hypothetical protein [Clostridia bacterium]